MYNGANLANLNYVAVVAYTTIQHRSCMENDKKSDSRNLLSKLRLSPEFQPAEEQVQRSGPLNLTQEAGTGYSTWHLVQHQHLVQLLASATVLASIGQLWHLLNFSSVCYSSWHLFQLWNLGKFWLMQQFCHLLQLLANGLALTFLVWRRHLVQLWHLLQLWHLIQLLACSLALASTTSLGIWSCAGI